MDLETQTCVVIAPELEQKLQANQEAYLCISGLAHLAATLLEVDKLPEFKRSLSLRLNDFFKAANELTESDFRDEAEVGRVLEAARLWASIGRVTWQELGIVGWNTRHTKVNIQKSGPKSVKKYTINIGPFGNQQD